MGCTNGKQLAKKAPEEKNEKEKPAVQTATEQNTSNKETDQQTIAKPTEPETPSEKPDDDAGEKTDTRNEEATANIGEGEKQTEIPPATGSDEKNAEKPVVDKSQEPSTKKDATTPPVPMSWAVSRNSHEVIRSSLNLMKSLLEKDDVEGFKEELKLYKRFLHSHALVEDENLFAYLATLGAEKTQWDELYQQHITDNEFMKKLEESTDLKADFPSYHDFMLNHLVSEEKLMVPLTQKSGSNPAERGKAFAEVVLQPMIRLGDWEWSLAFCIQRLTKFGTTDNPPVVGVRVFCHGLQYASSKKEWEEFKKIIKDNTSSDIWDNMVASVPEFNGEGKL